MFILKKNINITPIFCFKYEARNVPIQILQISNRLSGRPVSGICSSRQSMTISQTAWSKEIKIHTN